jgi:hypothetical protein
MGRSTHAVTAATIAAATHPPVSASPSNTLGNPKTAATRISRSAASIGTTPRAEGGAGGAMRGSLVAVPQR